MIKEFPELTINLHFFLRWIPKPPIVFPEWPMGIDAKAKEAIMLSETREKSVARIGQLEVFVTVEVPMVWDSVGGFFCFVGAGFVVLLW